MENIAESTVHTMRSATTRQVAKRKPKFHRIKGLSEAHLARAPGLAARRCNNRCQKVEAAIFCRDSIGVTQGILTSQWASKWP